MLATILTLKIVSWSFVQATHLSYTIEEAKNLSKTLLADYSTKIRPIWHQGQSVSMSVSFWLSAVNEISAVDQKMTTTGYLSVIWQDVSLQWNYDQNGIETMQFNQKDLWMPDLVLKNGFTSFKPLGGDFYFVYVNSDGTVFWYPYMVFESKCDIDVTYYPFDKQTCNIVFKTWSYTRWEVNLTVGEDKIGFFEFVPNSIWEVTSLDAKDDVSNSETDVTFIIHLRRKPYHYVMTLLIPVVFLGILNPVSFLIPSDAGEKMGYSVTIFLTFIVFLTIISEELPANSESNSIISIYLIIKLFVGVIIIFISSLQLRINHRKPSRKMSKGYKLMVRFEHRLRCTKNPAAMKDVEESDNPKQACEDDMEWSDVSSAIDFFAFWTLICVDCVITAVTYSIVAFN